MKRKLFAILFLIYLCMVCYLCFADFSSVDMDIPLYLFGFPIDKVVHFFMFMPFAFFLYYAVLKDEGKAKWGRRVLSLGVALVPGVIMAAITERVQDRLLYRSCDFMDFRADCCGLLAGALLVILIEILRISSRSSK